MRVAGRWSVALRRGARSRLTVAALSCALLGTVICLDRARGLQPVIAAPGPPLASLVADATNRTVPAGGWTAATRLSYRIAMEGGDRLRTMLPEAELQPIGQPFSGQPNQAGRPVVVAAHRVVATLLGLGRLRTGHRYHWRARLRDLAGSAGVWITGGSFGVETLPPPTPRLLSTNVHPGIVTARRTPSIHWSRVASPAVLAFYEYRVTGTRGRESRWQRSGGPELHLHGLPDGRWLVAIRAVDRAGNRSGLLRWPLTIDRTPPRVGRLSLSSMQITSAIDTAQLQFSLSEPAGITIAISRAGRPTTLARLPLGRRSAGAHLISWRGQDGAGHFLGSGLYRLTIRAVDRAGKVGIRTLDGLAIDGRRIVVSLGKQDLTAYDGSTVRLHALITSGGPETRTPLGVFRIMVKYDGFVMHSPWPTSSPLWYPDSPVNVALLFRDDGYFIHDAPWRTVYGPGSNAVDGIPGGNATGTHGCVNVPYAVGRWLYDWSSVGTAVQITA